MNSTELDSERCPHPSYGELGDRHGVSYERRRNEDGLPFDYARDDYQEGECDGCGQTVCTSRPDGNTPFGHFRLPTTRCLGNRSHGVHGTRTNGHGSLVNASVDDYQEGTCSVCRQMVYATRDSSRRWSDWRAKWTYVITEEEELW